MRDFWQEDGPVERGDGQRFNDRRRLALCREVRPQRAKTEDGFNLAGVHGGRQTETSRTSLV